MARSKRVLAEADPNAEAQPTQKKVSTGKARSKENDAPQTTVEEDNLAASRTSKSPASELQIPSTNVEAKVPGDADGKTWLCICQAKGKRCKLDESGVCRRYADANPEEWTVTKKGFELYQEWDREQLQRDQDNFGMHIFGDWSGYGTCEVMENMFLAFNTEVRKKAKDIWAIWSIVEAMALFLNIPDGLFQWHGIDDSEGNAKRVMLFGTAFLTTIDILVKENLFNSQGSDIRNVALVLGHFLNFAHDVEETCRANEDGWKTKVLDLADAHDIKPLMISSKRVISEIRTSKANATPDEHDSAKRKTQLRREGLQNAAKSYESRHLAGLITVESLKAGVKRSWVHWNWATELKAYSEAQAVKVGPAGPIYGKRIGGKYYDLTTKANQRQMKHYRLAAEDVEEESERLINMFF